VARWRGGSGCSHKVFFSSQQFFRCSEPPRVGKILFYYNLLQAAKVTSPRHVLPVTIVPLGPNPRNSIRARTEPTIPITTRRIQTTVWIARGVSRCCVTTSWCWGKMLLEVSDWLFFLKIPTVIGCAGFVTLAKHKMSWSSSIGENDERSPFACFETTASQQPATSLLASFADNDRACRQLHHRP